MVTSLAEVWIETANAARYASQLGVTSLAEVWIETRYGTDVNAKTTRHFPCGSVD